MLQDRQGFLWFGTLDGLNRWDGVEFVVLRHDPEDQATLSNSIVRALQQDRDGRLWVGTQAGVGRLDDHRKGFVRYPLAPAGRDEPVVHAIFESKDGRLWLGTSIGLFGYQPEQDRFVLVLSASEGLLPYSDVLQIQEGPHALWLLSVDRDGDPSRASLVRLDTSKVGGTAGDGSAIPLETFGLKTAGQPVYTFLIDRTGMLWLDSDVELPTAALAGGLKLGKRNLASTPVWTIFEDRLGGVWVGSEAGLVRAERARSAAVQAESARSAAVQAESARSAAGEGEEGWLQSFVLAITQDSSGTLWLGTLGGLYRSDPAAKPFVHLRADPRDPESLSTNAVSSLVEDREGQIWLGTFGGGLDMLGPDLVRRSHSSHNPADPESLCDDLIWDLHQDPEQSRSLWLGTESGLCSFNLETRRGRRHELPIPIGRGLRSRVTRIAAAEHGALWVGTFHGLVHFDPASGRAELLAPTGDERGPSDREISALLPVPGGLWVGTVGDTFDHFDLATRRFTHHRLLTPSGTVIQTEGIFDLSRTADGRLWLATGAGLHRLDPDGGRAHYSTRDGLPGSVIYSVAAGVDGALWLGTNHGLARLDATRKQPEQVRAYTLGDGIGSLEFNRGAKLEGRGGRLFFGGIDGLTVFDPRRIEENLFVPPVALTRIRTASRNGSRDYPVHSLSRLVLPPRHSTVTFEFAALAFTHAAENHYTYLLEGFDPHWVQAEHRRFARYTNLPPGQYVFRVRGSNSDGVWNLEGIALPVRVEPTIWQTLWFRITIASILLALLIAAYRYRVRSLLAVERLRIRVAEDLHDDLSSELAAVSLLADVMARQESLPKRDRSRLAEMRQRTLFMINALRDIVWHVNPEHDSLEATVDRARSLARSLLPEAEISFEASIPEREALSMPQRRDLYLVIKEAFHNIAQHAAADRVEVRLWVTHRMLRLEIKDNGRGLAAGSEQAIFGDGLHNMRARAERLGAELEIESPTGDGGVRLLLQSRSRR